MIIIHSFDKDSNWFRIYNENLFLKSDILFYSSSCLWTFDDKNIFQYKPSLYPDLVIFNWDLERQTIITSDALRDSNFYLPSASQIELFNSKFYFRHHNNIRIVNQTDMKLLNVINDISNHCNLTIDTRNGCLIALSKDSKKLLYFTPNGDLFYENELIDFPNNLEFKVNKRTGLIFYDSTEAVIYK